MDTGRLRASIRIEARRTLTLRSVYTIGSDVEYAGFVNDGTRRHFIRPKNGQYLRFRGRGGGWVFAKIVDHPGTKPRPFLDDALKQVAAQRGYSFREG